MKILSFNQFVEKYYGKDNGNGYLDKLNVEKRKKKKDNSNIQPNTVIPQENGLDADNTVRFIEFDA